MSNQALYLPCSLVKAPSKKKKAKEERENKPVKIKKNKNPKIQEAFFVELQKSCRMREKRVVTNKTTSK